MSVVTVRTSQGLRKVRIAGDEPTPEEIAHMRELFEEVPQGAQGPQGSPQPYMPDAGGTQTMPPPDLTPQRVPEFIPEVTPQATPQPTPPELKPEYLSPEERAEAEQYGQRYGESLEGPGIGTVATKMFRPRFAEERPDALAGPLEWSPGAITQGLLEATGHTLKTALSIAPENELTARALEESIKGIPAQESTLLPPRPRTPGEAMQYKQEGDPRESWVTGIARNPANATKHMTQFLAPYMLLSGGAPVLGVSGAGLPSPIAAFGAGGMAFDTQHDRLSNVIQDFPALENPVTEYLAHKPGSETVLEGALKNGVEMGVIDLGFSAIFMGALKMHRAASGASKRGQNPEEALRTMREHPNYDKQLELADATNFPADPARVGVPPPKLPKPEKVEIITKKGGKIAVDRAKENSLHASDYSESKLNALTKAREARNREAGFIKLGVDDFSKTPVAEIAKGTVEYVDRFIRPIKSRIIRTHPELGPRASTILDKFELEQNIIATEAYSKLEPLLKSYSRMNGADKKLWNSAYKQNNTAKLFDIARKYERGVHSPSSSRSIRKIKIKDFVQELRDGLNSFDEMYQLGIDNGVKMGYRKDYLPLKVKDFDKFRESIGRTGDRLEVLYEQEARKFATQNINKIKQPQGQQPIDPRALTFDHKTGKVFYNNARRPELELSDFAKDKIAENFMKAQETGGAGLGPKGMEHTLERSVTMTPKVEPHYYDFPEIVSAYPQKLAYEVAHNRLQGQVPGMEHLGYRKVLRQMQKDLNIPEGEAVGEIAELIGTRLRAGENMLAGKSGAKKFADNTFKGWRDFVYLTTLGNPFSTITQTSELGLNAYRNGIWNTLSGTKTATLDNLPKFMQSALRHKKEGMRMKDLGLSDIGTEYAGAGKGPISGSLNKLLSGGTIMGVKIPGALNLAGFRKIDFIMKEANMNGALLKAKKQLSTVKGEQAFKDRMKPFYQEETDALIKGIKSGNKKDDLTRLYLFQELAKTQPIALSEMPAAYLKSGGAGRSAYFLKTFTLKQIETARRDIFRKLASGNKAEAGEGFYNLLGLGVLFGGGTMGQTMLKDWLLERDNTKMSEYLIDAAAQTYIGQSRYSAMQFDRYDIPDAFWKTLKPATPVIEELFQDDFFSKTQKNWPLFGKYLYWTSKEGYGREIIRKDKAKGRSGRRGGRPPGPPKPPSPPKPPKY